jgi:predicted HAD superfamily Cof-like phosphohydrolase
LIEVTGWEMSLKTREDKVKEFRDAAGKRNFNGLVNSIDESVGQCLVEELVEFCDAAANYIKDCNEDTRKALTKEWADLQYVVSQAALYFGIPADAAFDRVHDSNMTKVVDGRCVFREDGKILKPDTYRAPDMGGL